MNVHTTTYELRPFALTHVAGHLDLTSASTLTEEVEPRLEPGQDLILDISAVAFVDAVGMLTVRSLARRIHETGGRVVISGGSISVRRALRRSTVDPYLSDIPRHPDRRDAPDAPAAVSSRHEGRTPPSSRWPPSRRPAVGETAAAASQLEHARRIARTQARRDRQLVEIAAALIDGDADRASGLAAEHGRDFAPDEELLGTAPGCGTPVSHPLLASASCASPCWGRCSSSLATAVPTSWAAASRAGSSRSSPCATARSSPSTSSSMCCGPTSRRRRRRTPSTSRSPSCAGRSDGDGDALPLRTVSQGYVLEVAPDDVDVSRFERLTRDGAAHVGRRPPRRGGRRPRRGARTVARTGARRVRVRGLRRRRAAAPGRAALDRPGAPDRRPARPRPPRAGGPRARGHGGDDARCASARGPS